MATVSGHALVYYRMPRTGSTWVAKELHSSAVDCTWTERGAQHDAATQSAGYTSPRQRERGSLVNVREPLPWLRSVYRWGTRGGNWHPLPGIASVLWPVQRCSWEEFLELHASRAWVDQAVEAYTRDVRFVLRTSRLPRDLCSALLRLGVVHDRKKIFGATAIGTSAEQRPKGAPELPCSKTRERQIRARNPICHFLSRVGRGVA